MTNERPAWLFPAVGAMLAAVLGLGAWFALRPDAPPTVVPSPSNSVPIEMTVTPSDLPTIKVPKPVDDPSNELASILMQADAYKDHGTTKESGRSLTFPPGENAVDLYKRVLTVEPDNAAAKKGLGEVAAFYLKSARALCDREIWSQCRNIAADGLKAEPDNTELRALQVQAEKRALGG